MQINEVTNSTVNSLPWTGDNCSVEIPYSYGIRNSSPSIQESANPSCPKQSSSHLQNLFLYSPF